MRSRRGAMWDSRVRAIDVKTGAVLWMHLVSAPTMALPAIYGDRRCARSICNKGEQYVAFAAGGNAILTRPGSATSWSLPSLPERRSPERAKLRAPRWRAEVGALRRHGAAELRTCMPPTRRLGATC